MSNADADIYHAVLSRQIQRSHALVSAIEHACRELPSADPGVRLVIRSLRLALVKFNDCEDC